ncbi:MAG TPA: L-threonylcarbamoyladenylate synthase [Desulfosporosinus sp.]|nr:L-threonylcarbamoyladenylate synthase [Desulfosporosinus sp.]
MDTKRCYIDGAHPEAELIKEGAEWLQAGELVAFPTETVYGLGANALDASACIKIFEAKGRPQDNPLIVHVCDRAMANSLVANWTPEAELCIQHFWPGPLTLVMTKTARVPDIVSAGLPNVAIRMPSHPVALGLIKETGLPIAAPSANLSGKPSPTSASHVWRDMEGKIPLILDGGSCPLGLESTVLEVSGGIPTILRPGGISKEQLEAVLGEVGVDNPSETLAPRAPGMKYRHYAPQGDMLLMIGSPQRIIQRMGLEIQKGHGRLKKVGVLCSLESAPLLYHCLPDLLFVLGSKNRPEEIARNLFEGLRLCDERGMDLILAEGVDAGGLGTAIMNRLQKAAGQRIVYIP